MSKRNMTWLAVIIGVGVAVWLATSIVWGLIAAGVVLVVSEVVERTARIRRRGAKSAGTGVRDVIADRRR